MKTIDNLGNLKIFSGYPEFLLQKQNGEIISITEIICKKSFYSRKNVVFLLKNMIW